jgi:hypothetical protein
MTMMRAAFLFAALSFVAWTGRHVRRSCALGRRVLATTTEIAMMLVRSGANIVSVMWNVRSAVYIVTKTACGADADGGKSGSRVRHDTHIQWTENG